jgi:hypothetical protein
LEIIGNWKADGYKGNCDYVQVMKMQNNTDSCELWGNKEVGMRHCVINA